MAGLRLIIGGVVAILVIWIVSSSWYTVDQGDLGVILRTGAVQGVAEPGLNFKIPLVDEVVVVSVRTEKRTYTDLASYSKDVQAAEITLSVNFHVNPAAVAEVYGRYGTTFVERAIDPVVPERLKEVFGQYQAAAVVADRVRLGREVEAAIQQNVPGELIVVESVQIENIDFSNAYEQAIEAAMQAEAEVRKSRNQLERERVEAEKVVVQANAKAEAVRAAAQAEADAIRLRGDAEGSAIRAKGDALRDNPTLVTLIAAEKWNGQLPSTMVPGSALPFIQVPSRN